ncbi:MAG: 5-methyltetrahydropteroyltriglutamate--homocysteine S-methyltransferase, partial [Burkholderiales bacterium]|nr:5-methyltetrahydropteroyltriglutamate--homocysteine S-methyltransferase [Burkholderiales bacterium]
GVMSDYWISASCSLLHVPVDLDLEHKLDDELRLWLAFAKQKLSEIVCIKNALAGTHDDAVTSQLEQANAAVASRRVSSRIHIDAVQRRVAQVQPEDAQRRSEFAARAEMQQAHLQLPQFPTTTIGSFPQTAAIRQARAAYKRKEMRHLDYLQAMRAEIAHVVEQQEKIGLDVLVHGEAERNDMVEYFGEQLWGYAFTEFGWVQSYGSRCVKPPMIYGDVFRPEAMTVSWSSYAQSLTKKPMKGMLTGPATMLQWSFVRDDQPRATTALQIALALRDEVADLQAAGIRVIQIDEPALREGLPLKQSEWQTYLQDAVFAFQLCAAVAHDETQIHTHMCYAEFNDILPWIAAMDADVISIETSRSGLDLLTGFSEFSYANQIGPGVYDIHSPRVASIAEMQHCIQQARQLIPDHRLWINPDCGLKTRAWPETIAALEKMVTVARLLRASVEEEECGSECC